MQLFNGLPSGSNGVGPAYENEQVLLLLFGIIGCCKEEDVLDDDDDDDEVDDPTEDSFRNGIVEEDVDDNPITEGS